MKRRKKGSSFVIVVVVMAIIFTTATAMIGLVANDYKMRINESKNLQNMYGSDSGLDVVYNIILKNSETAILLSNEKIKNNIANGDIDGTSYDDINEKFKEYFIEFLGQDPEGLNPNKESLLAKGILGGSYYKLAKDSDIEGISIIKNSNLKWTEVSIYEETEKKPEIEIEKYDVEKLNNKIEIIVKSTFSNLPDSNGIENKKIIEGKYNVESPDYQQVIESENINKYPIFDKKIITADGNLNMKGNIDISGDIWVKGYDGNFNNKPQYAFDKYINGISINNGTFNLKGNLYTANTLKLKTEANVNINGNLYALNSYLGHSNKTDYAKEMPKNNILTVEKDLIVNNDLALNSKSSTIKMNNFYGISDKTESNAENIQKALKSSSIIVNDVDSNSSITSSKAYIMGVAYIDTNSDEKYQTGESVAVKGNYLAYTDILDGYENRVTLRYYNPLQLIETIDGSNDATKKANYFSEYYNNEQRKSKLKSPTINLGEVYATGAYISPEGVRNSTSNNEKVAGEIKSRKNEFAQNVLSMGDNTGAGTLDDIYINGNVVKTVKNQINFNKINEINKESLIKTQGEVILNNSSEPNKESETIVIDKNKIKTPKGEIEVNYKNDTINALIVTNGNVIIKSGVKFKGNIIAGGNVTVENVAEKVQLTYDEELTNKIIASNYNQIKDIFNGEPNGHIVKIDVSNSVNGYDISSIVKRGRWKIIK
ncbi:hypothetical protein JCM1393_15950 [Clostridium carnis]